MSPSFLAALLLSGVIGICLGLLGGGGSTLALPVLVYVAGFAPRAAVGMSLAVVGSTSLAATLLHNQRGQLDVRVALFFGVAGMAGASVGARGTRLVSGNTLLVLFAILMLLVGAYMLAGGARRIAGRAFVREAPWLLLGAGIVVGVLTGFLGVGGGFLIVPALILFGGLTMPRAVGTSLAIITLNCTAGFIGQLGGDAIDLSSTAYFTAAAVAGALVGYRIGDRISPDRLRHAFAVLVLVTGGFIAVRSVIASFTASP